MSVSKGAVKSNILYSYPKVKYFNEFFNMKSALYRGLDEQGMKNIEINEKSGVQSEMTKLVKNLMSNREVVNGMRTNEKVMPQEVARVIRNIRIRESSDALGIMFPLTGIFSVVQKGNRSSCFEIAGVTITPETMFLVKNEFLIYAKEKYSIALKGDRFWLSLALEPSDEGLKGSSRVIVTYVDIYKYIIDDASKYMDVTALKIGTSV